MFPILKLSCLRGLLVSLAGAKPDLLVRQESALLSARRPLMQADEEPQVEYGGGLFVLLITFWRGHPSTFKRRVDLSSVDVL